jgi:hypothetical protein
VWVTLQEIVTFSAGLMTIAASGLAVFVFVTKREAIASAFRVLLTYSYQLTLAELKEKLERLNDYNANDAQQQEPIVNILHELVGQIRGNRRLAPHFKGLILQAERLAADKRRLTEPKKRAFVSELRERIRHLNVESMDDLLGEEE